MYNREHDVLMQKKEKNVSKHFFWLKHSMCVVQEFD